MNGDSFNQCTVALMYNNIDEVLSAQYMNLRSILSPVTAQGGLITMHHAHPLSVPVLRYHVTHIVGLQVLSPSHTQPKYTNLSIC